MLIHLFRQTLSRFPIVTVAGIVVVVLSGMLMLACQPLHPTKALPPQAAPSVTLPALAGTRYVVDPGVSAIRLLVYREGPLGHLGHNHVMTGRVSGEIGVSETAEASGFRLQIPLESFEVDLPGPRSEEGAEFAAAVSDAARLGTRKNMLGADLLDAEHYPTLYIESFALSGPRMSPQVSARITLRGLASEVRFPAVVDEQNGVITIAADFRVLQTELGLQPFSILGGAIRVRDAVDIRVRLFARREAVEFKVFP